MTGTAVALLLLGLLLAEPVSRALAAARWTARDPVGALLLWQAVGLAGGLALVGAGLCFGLSPVGPNLFAALWSLPGAVGALGVGHVLALLATVALATRLLGVLGLAVVRTLRGRRRHRDLIDLVATPWPAMSGARVLAHREPVAYCLPGLRSRLVVSSGALDALRPEELRAVLAHERAHLRERHDLVVLPFVAWGATAPFVPGMARAQAAVAALVEMRADDVARASVGGAAVVAALGRMSGAGGAAVLTSFGEAVEGRTARLTGRAPLPAAARITVRLAALALLAVPTAVLLLA
jgi:Zn-dependent protease with chaperone function